MYNRKASTKEERAQMRAEALEGYTVTEYPEADSVAGKMTAGNRTYIKIFDGTAAKPYAAYYFKTEAAADAYIAEHMKRRAANKAFDAEQKAKQEANRRNASPDLPRFEIGRSYYDKHYCDDGYDSEYITEIEIKDRSACFVTYCEKNRRGDSEPKRAKIKFDNKGEYISDGWNWYRAAALMPTEEEQAAQREAERKAREEKEQQDRAAAAEYFAALTEEARAIVESDSEPKAGAPYVIIEWSESPAINRLELGAEDGSGRKLSIKAADELFKLLDSRQNSDREKFDFLGWYDKTSFIIHFTNDAGEPETYEGRQDFGDGDGGIIEHIKAFAASYKSYSEKKPGDPMDEEIRADLAKFAQKLESYARPVYVLDADRTAEATKAIRAAKEKRIAEEANEINALLLMADDDDIEQLAREAPNRITKQFFIQELYRRDRQRGINLARELLAG